jgi:hypothetical protein
VVFLLTVVIAYHWGSRPPLDPWRDPDCGRDPMQTAANSPDHAWIARGITIGCGAGFVTTYRHNIVLVRPGKEPTPRDEVLIGDWRHLEWAALEWKTNDHLQITVPSIASVEQHRVLHAGVTVELIVEPPISTEELLAKDREWLWQHNDRLREQRAEDARKWEAQEKISASEP